MEGSKKLQAILSEPWLKPYMPQAAIVNTFLYELTLLRQALLANPLRTGS
jgi:hypothetical protein